LTVLAKPRFLSAGELGLPAQVIALPWVSRSGFIAAADSGIGDTDDTFIDIESRLSELVEGWLANADPALPVILTAHASVQGAVYGSERTVMLGADVVLSGSLVRNPRLDYVALGHIHKPQDLNPGAHPPVIYPGSIERVDFGEAQDDKFFIIAQVEKGHTEVTWRRLEHVRPFIDRSITLTSPEDVTATLLNALPAVLQDAIVRLIVKYPRQWDALIDEPALRRHASGAFEFHLIRRPQVESRIRLPADQTVGSLHPLELLDQYWRASHQVDAVEVENLNTLARTILEEDAGSQAE
jgi:exonuclease SbcD